jgi:hypothetical protein
VAPTHIGNIDIELAKVVKRLGPVDDLNAPHCGMLFPDLS